MSNLGLSSALSPLPAQTLGHFLLVFGPKGSLVSEGLTYLNSGTKEDKN
jgi:hypothetical protein